MTAQLEQRGFLEGKSAALRGGEEAHALVERFRAPFSLRCGALLIDYILVAGIVAFSTLWARAFGGGARFAGGTAETLGFIIALGATVLNFVLLPLWRGQTIGKWATGLFIQTRDGSPLGVGRIILRHVVGYPLSLITLGLGFLLAAFNPEGRALHDIIAGTTVVLEEGRLRRV